MPKLISMPEKGAYLKWVEFFKATNCSNLPKLIELVLSVPVSNAPVESLFSYNEEPLD